MVIVLLYIPIVNIKYLMDACIQQTILVIPILGTLSIEEWDDDDYSYLMGTIPPFLCVLHQSIT